MLRVEGNIQITEPTNRECQYKEMETMQSIWFFDAIVNTSGFIISVSNCSSLGYGNTIASKFFEIYFSIFDVCEWWYL